MVDEKVHILHDVMLTDLITSLVTEQASLPTQRDADRLGPTHYLACNARNGGISYEQDFQL